jgi:hypothetical protein
VIQNKRIKRLQFLKTFIACWLGQCFDETNWLAYALLVEISLLREGEAQQSKAACFWKLSLYLPGGFCCSRFRRSSSCFFSAGVCAFGCCR